MDPGKAEQYRAASLDQWEGSAANWSKRAAELQTLLAPISHWMVEEVRPQPGQTVLELAAGPGETGFLVAELLRPGGKLISTDFADAMIDAARERAAARGLDNVEFRRMDAEAMDFDTASVDGVLCRFGYMLMADPGAALRETRRVLRPLGRVALAAWAAPADNPWVSIAADEVRRAAGAPDPEPGAPGMFAFADPGRIVDELAGAGFTDVRVEALDLRFAYPSFDDWWTVSRELGRPLSQLLDGMDPDGRESTVAAIRERVSDYTTPEGGLEFPARPLVAAGTA